MLPAGHRLCPPELLLMCRRITPELRRGGRNTLTRALLEVHLRSPEPGPDRRDLFTYEHIAFPDLDGYTAREPGVGIFITESI
jgi:hypothetical protein